MIRNVYNAVTAAGQSSNAIGLMVTDWSGSMFINQPTVSFPGFAVAGGLAWNKNVEMVRFYINICDCALHSY